jgi:hypothetical protein
MRPSEVADMKSSLDSVSKVIPIQVEDETWLEPVLLGDDVVITGSYRPSATRTNVQRRLTAQQSIVHSRAVA